MSDARAKRLKIMRQDEIDALYGRPNFTHEERIEFFSLSMAEKGELDELHSIKSRIYFILQLGYFKCRKMFFLFSPEEVSEDLEYIRQTYFPESVLGEFDISKRTRLKQQHLVLGLFDYRNCDIRARRKLMIKARSAAVVCGRPIYVFREIIDDLETHKVVIPGYTFLQDAVGDALSFEQNRMSDILRDSLKPNDEKSLTGLLENTSCLHEITYLKREPKNFSVTEIKRETERGEQMRSLYQLSQRLLIALAISNENVKYYASLVTYYSVYKLKRFDRWIVYVYLLCFVHHRYQRHIDNLISGLIYHVRRFADASREAAKERVYKYRSEANQNLYKAAKILKLFADDDISKDAPFHEVRAKAFNILERREIEHVADHIATKLCFDETAFQWDHIDDLGFRFKRSLRPILSSIDFKGSSAQTSLIEAIDFLKIAYRKGRPLGQYPVAQLPVRFIPEKLHRYIYTKERLVPDRYEFLICRLLRERVETGDIFCRESVRFRSFEDDLIDDKRWQSKNELIEATGLSLLKQPITEHLDALERELEDQLTKVNKRIESGDNNT